MGDDNSRSITARQTPPTRQKTRRCMTSHTVADSGKKRRATNKHAVRVTPLQEYETPCEQCVTSRLLKSHATAGVYVSVQTFQRLHTQHRGVCHREAPTAKKLPRQRDFTATNPRGKKCTLTVALLSSANLTCSTKAGWPSLVAGCGIVARGVPSRDQSLALPSLDVDWKPMPGARSSERTGPECSRKLLSCVKISFHPCLQAQPKDIEGK